MADNYVSIRLTATDEAKPDLTDLKARLDELSHKVATARAQVEDKDAEAVLAALDLKLKRIADKVVDPKIRMRGAERALADLLAVDVAMDRMNKKAADLKLKADGEAAAGGLLSRLLFGKNGTSPGSIWGSLLSGFQKPGGLIPGLGGGGGAAGGGGEAAGGGLLDSLASILGTAGAAVPVVAALLVEVDGLASGFLAAGAGAGAFGLLALPAFKKVSTAYQQIQADHQAYDRALTATARNNALKHLQQDYAALDPTERQAVKGIQSLSGEFGKMSKAFEPQAFKIFSDVLKIANQLLPDIVPFANTFAAALHGLLGDAGKFAGSQGFKDWLSQFQKLEGPSLNAIGAGIGHIVTSIGKLFTIMSAKDVTNAINIAFSVIDGAILGLGWTISHIMHWWDVLSHAFAVSRHAAAAAGDGIMHAWDSVRHATAELGHDVAAWFDRIRGTVARLPGQIAGALASLPGMLFKIGVNAVRGLLHGAESMIGGVLGTVANWGHDIANAIGGAFGIHFSEPSEATQMVKAGRNVALGLAKGITGGRPAVEQAARTVGAAGLPRGGYARGGGERMELVIRLEGGDEPILRAFRNAIRVRGGSVQTVLGAS